MKDLYDPVQLNHSEVNGRNVWHYLFRTTIGELHLVEHEAPGLELLDDYLGRSNQKAEKAFKRATGKILKGE